MGRDSSHDQPCIRPRIIIHGGAGNLNRATIPKESYETYRSSLLTILESSSELLSKPDATILDVATHAVSLLEDDPLYNSGKGAVFTRAGTQELESSIMVSNGYKKRGVGTEYFFTQNRWDEHKEVKEQETLAMTFLQLIPKTSPVSGRNQTIYVWEHAAQ
jgi:hypothetical protein